MRVHIDSEVCKGCGLCLRTCPAEVFTAGGGTNSKGYGFVVAANEGKCVGCGRCEACCPDLAIFVER